ncbi:hypothetical protein BDN70DRAFT_887975 [Pholiota conissans]|uniref:Secreted protein n=1 Tax=Pholiota conissans TaxID=109636 RepID=A0A9P5YPF8_9AGAR|nr:hypothetical protein BDN70DRAFT_887975 [Pholiota conissans]
MLTSFFFSLALLSLATAVFSRIMLPRRIPYSRAVRFSCSNYSFDQTDASPLPDLIFSQIGGPARHADATLLSRNSTGERQRSLKKSSY